MIDIFILSPMLKMLLCINTEYKMVEVYLGPFQTLLEILS